MIKNISYLTGWLYGQLAILSAAAKLSAAFWTFAILCWERSKFVTPIATGAIPGRSLPLRLVDLALSMPHADKMTGHALHRPNVTATAYYLMVLKRAGNLNLTVVKNVLGTIEGSILLKNGQFVVEISLRDYAAKLLNKKCGEPGSVCEL